VVLAKVSLIAVPWMVKATSVVVAATPATVPLSCRTPVARVVAEVNLATKPLVPPVTLVGDEVAITLPFWSTARKEEVKALPRDS